MANTEQLLQMFVICLKKDITQDQRIMKLDDLCDIYKCVLKDRKHANSGYIAEKLKKKLEQSDICLQKL